MHLDGLDQDGLEDEDIGIGALSIHVKPSVRDADQQSN